MNNQEALEDIEFIKKVIQDSRRNLVESGIQYIVWGILVTIGLLSTYLQYIFSIKFSFIYVWIVLIGGGWIYSWYDLSERRKKQTIRTFAGKIIGSVWLASGIAMTIIGFIGTSSGSVRGDSVSPLLAVIVGSSFYVVSIINGENRFKIVALCWWAGAIAMFFINGMTNLLIMALLMVFGQVLPGILLYIKYKKELKNSNE